MKQKRIMMKNLVPQYIVVTLIGFDHLQLLASYLSPYYFMRNWSLGLKFHPFCILMHVQNYKSLLIHITLNTTAVYIDQKTRASCVDQLIHKKLIAKKEIQGSANLELRDCSSIRLQPPSSITWCKITSNPVCFQNLGTAVQSDSTATKFNHVVQNNL